MEKLFILHGWGSSKEKWQRTKELIEKEGIKVILPEIPGLDTQISKAWDLSDYLNWFEDISRKDSPFFLLGHSFGGRVAIKFAAKNPERPKGLILVSAAGIKRKPSFWVHLAKIFRKFSFLPGFSFLRKLFYKFILRKTDYIKTSGYLKETFKKIVDEDLRGYLDKIDTKTLIIWGKRDKITPLDDAYLMKEKIKNSKLEILDNIGHAPYLENPEILSKKIINFIKNKE